MSETVQTTNNSNGSEQPAVRTVETAEKFTISQQMMREFMSQGLTVDEMADKITSASGIKCSAGVVRTAAKHYGISLRNKPKKSPFVLE